MNYAAVVAAAGLSSRMNDFKPMLRIGQNTMIELVIGHLRAAGAGEIVAVVGYQAALLRRHLEPLAVTVCENPAYAQTKMFDSLCLGIRSLQTAYDALLLTPGDVPLVRPETIKKMMEIDAEVVRPVCGGKLGHPVLLRKSVIPAVLCSGGDRGLLGAVEALGVPIVNFETEDVGVLLDADTPEDLQALRRRAAAARDGGTA